MCVVPAHDGYGKRRPTGPSPVDRERAGHKRHLITDGSGTVLPVTLTGSSLNVVTRLPALVDAAKRTRRIGPATPCRGNGMSLHRWVVG